MCLITKWIEPKVAETDIVCFKTMYRKAGKIISSFEFFEYELDKLYQTEMQEDPTGSAYDGLDGKLLAYYIEKNIPYKIIGAGFHAGLTSKRLNNYGDDHTFLCIIPKDSLYYKDETGLIVANQIIIKEEVLE